MIWYRIIVCIGLCASLGARAQIPTYRLAGADTLYRFDFSSPVLAKSIAISGNHQPFDWVVDGIGDDRTVDVYDGDKLLFYERNDSFFNAAGIAIFELKTRTVWDGSIKNRKRFYSAAQAASSWAFGIIYDYEIYTIRNPRTESTDIVLRAGNNATLHKFTLPDDANRWMTDAELMHDSVENVWLRDITATRTADGLGNWLLGSNNEFIFVFKLQNDKLTLVHQYDSLPGGWGGMELYSAIALNNAGDRLAVGSYSITNPLGYMGQKTRLSSYTFSKTTGMLSADRILRTEVLDERVLNSLEDGGILDYSPNDTSKYYQQQQFGRYPMDQVEVKGVGSMFINLCYTANDSIIYASHVGAPFGVEYTLGSFDRNTGAFSHSNVMAVNVNTGGHITVELEKFIGYQILLQANGQVWIQVNEGANADWYVIPYPEEVFDRGEIEFIRYKWPIDRKNPFKIVTFNRGLHEYKRLDMVAIDSCLTELSVRITADTSYFESFRIEQGSKSFVISKQELEANDNIVPCPSFQQGVSSITVYGIRSGYEAQSKTRQLNLKATNRKPIAFFTISDTTGCQWVNYQLSNESTVFEKGENVNYYWDFGNGKDTTVRLSSGATSSLANVDVVYTASGRYPISLVVDDGFCTDSFSTKDSITILEAPQPGITLTDSIGCEPLDLVVENTFASITDSIIYHWADGTLSHINCLPECSPKSKTYMIASDNKKEDVFRLVQELYGPTGCVTSDTATIKVFSSFLPTDTPYLSLVSVSDEQLIRLEWDSMRHSSYYNIYRNGQFLDSVKEVSIVLEDNDLAKIVSSYSIEAVNVCKENSALSNLSENLLLVGEGSENNELGYLNWNTYVGWQGGVASYELEEVKNGFIAIPISGKLPNELSTYVDNDFLNKEIFKEQDDELLFQKCYKLTAAEKITGTLSHSNLACVAYRPVLIVPSAFTPNQDGLNDSYSLVAYGYTSILLEVYNQWGEKIHEGISWDGKVDGVEAPMSVYTVLFSGETNEGVRDYRTFTISLIR